MKTRIGLLSAVSSAAILLPGRCLAQGTGVIYGSVHDPTGASIAGAEVKAVFAERGTSRAGTTSAAGEYTFSVMPIGTYEVVVSATGFEQFRRLWAGFAVRAEGAVLGFGACSRNRLTPSAARSYGQLASRNAAPHRLPTTNGGRFWPPGGIWPPLRR